MVQTILRKRSQTTHGQCLYFESIANLSTRAVSGRSASAIADIS